MNFIKTELAEKINNLLSTKFINKQIVVIALLLFVSFMNAQENNEFNKRTALTKEVTTKYFKAYMELQFDAMKPMMHEAISFEDPTAKLIFEGKIIEGKQQVYENFKVAYASILEMKQKSIRTIFSSDTGIFEINLIWKLKVSPTKTIHINMPLNVVLTVENGKVIKHRDYGDYNYFVKQYNNQIKS